MPSGEELNVYYSHYSYTKEVQIPKSTARSINATLKMLRRMAGKKNLIFLDFGCGQGDVVLIARDLGFSAYGFEVSKAAVERCSERGVPLLSLSQIENMKFDVVTAYEVVEHLARPSETLLLLSDILCNEGILYLTTPNSNSLSNRRGRLSSLLYPEHLTLFSKHAISIFAPRYGFSVVDVKTEGLKSQFLLSLRDSVSDFPKDHRVELGENCYSEKFFVKPRCGTSARIESWHIVNVGSMFKESAFYILLGSKKLINFILTLLDVGETLKVTLRKVNTSRCAVE